MTFSSAASGFPGYHDELSDAELEIYLRDPAGDHTLAVIEFRYILKLYQDTFLLPGQQTLSGDPLLSLCCDGSRFPKTPNR